MHVNCGSPLSRDSTMLQHTVYRVIFVGGNFCEKREEALRIKIHGINFELSMHSQTLAGKSLAT